MQSDTLTQDRVTLPKVRPKVMAAPTNRNHSKNKGYQHWSKWSKTLKCRAGR